MDSDYLLKLKNCFAARRGKAITFSSENCKNIFWVTLHSSITNLDWSCIKSNWTFSIYKRWPEFCPCYFQGRTCPVKNPTLDVNFRIVPKSHYWWKKWEKLKRMLTNVANGLLLLLNEIYFSKILKFYFSKNLKFYFL